MPSKNWLWLKKIKKVNLFDLETMERIQIRNSRQIVISNANIPFPNRSEIYTEQVRTGNSISHVFRVMLASSREIASVGAVLRSASPSSRCRSPPELRQREVRVGLTVRDRSTRAYRSVQNCSISDFWLLIPWKWHCLQMWYKIARTHALSRIVGSISGRLPLVASMSITLQWLKDQRDYIRAR